MGDYLAENWSVTNTSSKLYRIKKELGHIGSIGYIVSDGGTIFIQISKKDGGAQQEMKAQLDDAEKLDFEKADRWKLGEILITTDSATAISGRIFVR